MKRSGLLIALILFFFTYFAGTAIAQDGVLKITEMSGKVLVKINPSNDWVDAKMGEALNPKDVIKTEADGKVMLEFPDKSSFKIGRASCRERVCLYV